jgi:hypothetical protein
MDVITVGKSKIRIDHEGCHDCGTVWSSGWKHFKDVELVYNKRRIVIPIQICADCSKRYRRPDAKEASTGAE